MRKILFLLALSGCALDLAQLRPEDAGVEDTGFGVPREDSGYDAGEISDSGQDSLPEDTGVDSGIDSGIDSGYDAGPDSGSGVGGPCPCTSGLACCDGVCIDVLSDVNHCGECGSPCGANRTCNSGRCWCGDLLCRPDVGCYCSAELTCEGSSSVCRIGG